MSGVEKHELLNEQALLWRIAAGDEKAFAELFHHYKNKIYTTGFRMTDSDIEAEEIVQDVFVKLWTKREALPGIENLEGYIFMMARNYTYNSLQKKVRETRHTTGLPTEIFSESLSEIPVHLHVEAKELQQVLQQAIHQLPPQQRQVYHLIRNEGLTKQQASEEMGISVHTVKTHFDASVRAVRAHVVASLEFFLLFFMMH